MAHSNIYVGVAGYFGRPHDPGAVGVFRRRADGGEWEHVLAAPEVHTVFVHPEEPDLVFAGTADGVWRSTDRGAELSGAPTFRTAAARSGASSPSTETRTGCMQARRRSASMAARRIAGRAGAGCPHPGSASGSNAPSLRG